MANKYKIILKKNNFQKVGDKIYGNLLEIFTPYLEEFKQHNHTGTDIHGHDLTNMNNLSYLIADAMTTERNTMGFFNKYDEIDLETPYTLLAVNMDKDLMSYDEFVNHLFIKNKLPFYYPVEFILRILSRILNVVIHFCYDDFHKMHIDNTIELNPYDIYIYQTTASSYYIIETTKLSELENTKLPPESKIDQNEDIIEI